MVRHPSEYLVWEDLFFAKSYVSRQWRQSIRQKYSFAKVSHAPLTWQSGCTSYLPALACCGVVVVLFTCERFLPILGAFVRLVRIRGSVPTSRRYTRAVVSSSAASCGPISAKKTLKGHTSSLVMADIQWADLATRTTCRV